MNGAYLGVAIGPLNFQPSELAKICIVIFLASYLREKREVLIVGARRILGVTLPPLKHFGPLLVVWGASMVMLVFTRDLGSSLMFFGAFLVMIYVATNRLSFVVIGLAMFFVGAYFMAGSRGPRRRPLRHLARPVRLRKRRRRQGLGQIAQSLYAQADGGLFGRGLGRVRARAVRAVRGQLRRIEFPECNSIVPAPHTDFIYAVIVNELGLFGACGVICIYALSPPAASRRRSSRRTGSPSCWQPG